MIKFIKNKLKKVINFFLLLNHRVLNIGTKNESVLLVDNHILDLDREWKLKSNKIEVISYQGDPSQSFGNDYPVIESWIAQNNISFTVNNYFRETQYKKIIKEKNKNKNINELNEKVYVLPYYYM